MDGSDSAGPRKSCRDVACRDSGDQDWGRLFGGQSIRALYGIGIGGKEATPTEGFADAQLLERVHRLPAGCARCTEQKLCGAAIAEIHRAVSVYGAVGRVNGRGTIRCYKPSLPVNGPRLSSAAARSSTARCRRISSAAAHFVAAAAEASRGPFIELMLLAGVLILYD